MPKTQHPAQGRRLKKRNAYNVYVYVSEFIYACLCMYVCLCVYIFEFMHACIRIMHAYAYVCAHACEEETIYPPHVCCSYMCTYSYMYTYEHVFVLFTYSYMCTYEQGMINSCLYRQRIRIHTYAYTYIRYMCIYIRRIRVQKTYI